MWCGTAQQLQTVLADTSSRGAVLETERDSAMQARELYLWLTGITVAAETAADLSRKMLEYAGKQPGQKRTVELNQLVERMLPLFRSGAGVRQNVEFLPSTHPVFTEADDGQLEQILLNLVTNAAHAMSNCRGKITIRVGSELLDQIPADPALFGNRREGGDFAWFEITDSGSGIPESDLTRVFEPFYTTKHHSQSHGFGLAIVYGHVNRHDGLIRLRSTKDVGTTFRILLPRLSEFHTDSLRVNGDSLSHALFRFRCVSSLLQKPFRPTELVKAISSAAVSRPVAAVAPLQRGA